MSSENLFENLQLMHKFEGINKKDNTFVFDYDKDDEDSIINLLDVEIYKSSINANVYYFGYVFKDNINSKVRTEFINYIKGYGNNKINENELIKFIDRPLGKLNKEINLSNIDVIVYPESKLNNLNNIIIKSITNFMSHGKEYVSYKMIKNIPSEIQFDYKSFEADCNGKDSQKYKDSIDYIKSMLDKTNTLDYFSIAKNIKSKYRKYIMNYLKPETNIAKETLDAKNILIVDDINTSGSTLRELLRIINEINSNCNIYIYTLIGKN